MPTSDRRSFVALAIRRFLRQDHPSCELVVLDDGADPVADLMPDDPRIRYERLPAKVVLGTKRNLAAELARGEILVHWDDDDWYAPNRITLQVGALRASGADVCGVSSLVFYGPAEGAAWRYTYPDPSARPWVAGTSLCYRRGFWARNRFDSVSVGEDTRMLWRSRSSKIIPIKDDGLVVALMHGANTSRRYVGGSRWASVPVDAVLAIMGEDADSYQAAVFASLRQPTPSASAR